MANEAVHTLSVYSGQFLIASVLTVKNTCVLMLQSMMSHVHQAVQVAGDRKENSVMPFHVEFVTALRQTEDVFLYLRS